MQHPAGKPIHGNGWANGSIQGVGLGLRQVHIDEILQTKPDVPWFELLADNHLAKGGLIPAQLTAIRSNYPITLHCTGMSLAGTEPLDYPYLKSIRQLAKDYEASWISDHVCFTNFGGHHYHDLLPVPYNEESLLLVSERISRIQDFLGERLLIENVSSYLEFSLSDMTEAEFITELVKKTDCRLLLDLNNIHVNSVNHNSVSTDYIDTIPLQYVEEIHLAGYEDREDYLLDAHNNHVSDAVWDLYRQVTQQRPDIPTLIEWDNNIPAFSVLQQEAQQAENIVQGNSHAIAQ